MRRWSTLLLTAIMLMLVLGAIACGGSSSAAFGDESPEAILAAAIDASENMESAAGSFDVTLTFDADLSQVPEEEREMAGAFMNGPIKLSGTFTAANEPVAADISLSLSMAGETMDVGMKMIDSDLWVLLADQWYEAPPEVEESMAQSSTDEDQAEAMKQLLDELGIDPVTWLTGAQVVGEEKIDGVDCYHLSGSPDIAKAFTDILGLMASEEFMSLADPSGMAGESMGASGFMPSPDEMQEAQTQITQMFKDLKVDLWVAKDTATLYKTALTAQIVPPAGEDPDGLNAINIAFTFALQDVNEGLSVTAPSSSKSYEELEKLMEENPEAIFGPFMGIMGGAMGGFGGAGFDEGLGNY